MTSCVCALPPPENFLPPELHEEVLLRKLRLTSDMYTHVYTYTILYHILYSTIVLNSTIAVLWESE